ncbi:hypothetical protein AZH51_16135 [Branchiibius sp. NY16-3462-2]|nr:hypothetical protein AZH51_16135 [Branchiibius sp. NY16-3462-2]
MRDDHLDDPQSGIIRPTRSGRPKAQRPVASMESALSAAAWLPRGYCLGEPACSLDVQAEPTPDQEQAG